LTAMIELNQPVIRSCIHLSFEMEKQIRLAITSIITGTILLSSLFVGVSCANTHLDVPTPMTFAPILYVTIDQVTNEYKLDPIKADSKYKGQRLLFNSVTVDEVHKIWSDRPGSISATVDYFRSGGIRFELLDYRGAQQRVQVGFVLKLDGICQGLVGDLVEIRDCSAESIVGDIGVGLPAAGGY
jgi:hypothetical protein